MPAKQHRSTHQRTVAPNTGQVPPVGMAEPVDDEIEDVTEPVNDPHGTIAILLMGILMLLLILLIVVILQSV